MSDEKKNVNEMDAAEMLAGYQAEHSDETDNQEDPGEWVLKLDSSVAEELRRWHHRQGWNAFGLALLAGATALSCAAALIGGLWEPVVVGIGLINLVMAGAWLQKAKAGWSA